MALGAIRSKLTKFRFGGVHVREAPAQDAPGFGRRHGLALRVFPAVNGLRGMTLDDHDFVSGTGVTGLRFLEQRHVSLSPELTEQETIVGKFSGEWFHGGRPVLQSGIERLR